ncbi:hypothetical protein CPB86DRAFT_740330 [Serendipita vermifera]|nr:hypothetical protein CPB86DRAFT_740330 [Serendipita vermifera]
MSLVLQTYRSARAFLQVIDDLSASGEETSPGQGISFDDANTNFIIGAARDLVATKDEEGKSIWMILKETGSGGEAEPATGAYEGKASIKVLVASPILETYYLTSPGSVDVSSVPPVIFPTITNTIRSEGLSTVTSAFGMKALVGGFLEAWSKSSEPILHIRAEPYLATRLASLGAPKCKELSKRWAESKGRSPFRVVDIIGLEGSEEVKARLSTELVQCIKYFWGSDSDESTETAVRMVNGTVERKERGRLLVCLATAGTGESTQINVAGYLYTGRETPKSIAIRNVFTHGTYRGKGVAKSLVQMVCEWWLLRAEMQQRKEYITLYVEPANTAATHLYVQCGFDIGTQPWERRGFEEIGMGAF